MRRLRVKTNHGWVREIAKGEGMFAPRFLRFTEDELEAKPLFANEVEVNAFIRIMRREYYPELTVDALSRELPKLGSLAMREGDTCFGCYGETLTRSNDPDATYGYVCAKCGCFPSKDKVKRAVARYKELELEAEMEDLESCVESV